MRSIILPAAIALTAVVLPSVSFADGPPSWKDDRSAVRHQNYSASVPKPDLKRYVTMEEQRYLKRIHARAMRRMQEDRNFREQAYYGRLKSRKQGRYGQRDHVEPVASRRYYREEETVSRSRCMPVIKATGVERTLRWRAEESARKAWRREAIDTHGYRYANGFSSTRVSCDNIRGAVYICRASGRPCRED